MEKQINISIPNCPFGKVEYTEKNGEYTTTKIIEISNEEHLKFLDMLTAEGFKETEKLFYGGSPFRTMQKDNQAVFVSYYPQWEAMFIKKSGRLDSYKTEISIPEIDFGIVEFVEKENDLATSISVIKTSRNDFCEYTEKIKAMDFSVFQKRQYADCDFIALKKGEDAIYLSYYPRISEMRIVAEKNSAYPGFKDNSRSARVSTLVTQINLTDFGLSEVIRLSDGRFIIFDGGWHFERDVDKLLRCLYDQKEDDEKPIIAAWFLTHAHCDHFWCFTEFYKKYKDKVVIEKLLYNFSDVSEEYKKAFPPSFEELKRWNVTNDAYIEKLSEIVKNADFECFCPHTGQSFAIGNAFCEILSSPDDVVRTPVAEGNSLSLITKMTIEGQVIMWFGDGYFAPGKIVERYEDYLKADILQIPHHGFSGATIKGYNAVNPDVCIAPSFDDDCFANTCIHTPEFHHLVSKLNVKELFAGRHYTDENITIQLPYRANPNGKKQLSQMIEDGSRSLGSRIWYFNDLVINDESDVVFTVLNAAGADDVYVTVYMEDSKKLRRLRYKVCGMRQIDLAKLEESDGNPIQEFSDNYPQKKIPKGKMFCVKFECRTPVVISSKDRVATYYY